MVCPVDPFVEEDYYKMLRRFEKQAHAGEANLVLMGIEPASPSEKYGYIIPSDKNEISWVDEFWEKPDEATAKLYIRKGALWNGGVFAYKLKYVLDKAHELMDFLNLPVLCMGLKDVVISASPEGILVSDKKQSEDIKPYVDQLAGRMGTL